jgi:hypothetical protein
MRTPNLNALRRVLAPGMGLHLVLGEAVAVKLSLLFTVEMREVEAYAVKLETFGNSFGDACQGSSATVA